MKDSMGRSDDSLPARRTPGVPLTPPRAEVYDDYAHDAPHQAGGKAFSLRMLNRALRRHWWQALLLWLIGSVGLMSLAYSKIKPTYDAVSQVKVELDSTAIFAANGQPQDYGLFMKSQEQMITNPTIIGAALAAHPSLAGTPMLRGTADPEIEIRKALRVGMVPHTQFIQIEMSSPVQNEAADIVNAVVEAYLKQAQATYDTSTQKKIDNMKISHAEQEVVLAKRRMDVKVLTEKIGAATEKSLLQRNQASVDDYRRFSEQLTNVEIEVIKAKTKLDYLSSLRDLPRPQDRASIQAMVNEAFLVHPQVTQIQDEIEKAERKLKSVEHLTARSHNDPAYVRQSEMVRDLNARREELWQKLHPTLERQVTTTPIDADMDRQIKEAELDLAAKRSHKDMYEQKLVNLQLRSKDSEGHQLELEYAQKDRQRAEDVLDRIDRTLSQYVFDAKNPTAKVDLVYKATPSNMPNSNRRTQIIAAAPLAVGMLVLGLLFLMELRGARVSDPDELASRMQMQVIGVVPPLPQIRSGSNGNGSGDGPVGALATGADLRAQRELDAFVQSLDHLRVSLCARRDPWGRDRHCVLITSAIGSEGKTTLAAQLAERCVNAGLMTLVIDGDLRNPTLSRMLDAAENPGLINVLRGEMSAEDVVMVIGDAGGFHLLPAGTPRVDPSRLLQGERLGKLIAQARESFDMIIVDAPPVLPVPDALTIGRWTDGAILAVRYDTSRFPLVERANRRLAHVGVPVIGAVVNGVRSSESAYGGYYAYGYGATSYGNVSSASSNDD